MIDLDLTLPLARFTLEVRATLERRVVAVLGPSGSGKTSLLEAIAGLRAARGRIVVDDTVLQDGARGLPPERRRVGWVPQNVALFPHLDVRGNVAFGARLGDRDARRRIDEAIEVLALAPLLRRMPETLSGGERQRVALARALAIAPRVLLLDEPLAAIDAEHRARILPWLLRVREASDVPMLYVTHNLGEAFALAGEALLLREGRVAAHGPVSDLCARLDGVPDLALDNVLVGELRDDELALENGATLIVPRGAPGRATYVLPAEEIVLAGAKPSAVSARNVLEGRVASVDAMGADALVHVDTPGARLRAKVTARAVAELALEPGAAVFLLVKTQSLRRLE